MQRLDAKANFGRRILDTHMDAFDGLSVPSNVSNKVKAMAIKQASSAVLGKDKADRATVEQAIDPRTRMVLFKMLNRWGAGGLRQAGGRAGGRGATVPPCTCTAAQRSL
jgi:hypothetical protein